MVEIMKTDGLSGTFQKSTFGISYAFGDLFCLGCIVLNKLLDKTEFVSLAVKLLHIFRGSIGNLDDLAQIVAGIGSDVSRIREQQLAVDKSGLNALSDDLIKNITKESCAVELSAAQLRDS